MLPIITKLVAGFQSLAGPLKPVQQVENTLIQAAFDNFGYVAVPADQYGIPTFAPAMLSAGHAQALDNYTARSRLSPIEGGGFG